MIDAETRQFLSDADWQNASVTPIAGDLSARKYFRAAGAGKTAILMDSRRDRASLPGFVSMTHWLRGAEVSAPDIYADGTPQGFLLLEDFGDQQLGPLLGEMPELIESCIDLLIHLRGITPPQLPCPRPRELSAMVDVACYVPGAKKDAISAFQAELETLLTEIQTKPSVSLRDFHSENIMWLPNRDGIGRLGLLDFQDAFLTHPVYDLVSLLTDARRVVPPSIRDAGIARYAQTAGEDLSAVKKAFAVFSAQRNLRILGIFARAAARDGKSHHVAKMPLVYQYLTDAVQHPVFANCRDDLFAGLPEPMSSGTPQ